jgi:hypothetical protein
VTCNDVKGIKSRAESELGNERQFTTRRKESNHLALLSHKHEKGGVLRPVEHVMQGHLYYDQLHTFADAASARARTELINAMRCMGREGVVVNGRKTKRYCKVFWL